MSCQPSPSWLPSSTRHLEPFSGLPQIFSETLKHLIIFCLETKDTFIHIYSALMKASDRILCLLTSHVPLATSRHLNIHSYLSAVPAFQAPISDCELKIIGRLNVTRTFLYSRIICMGIEILKKYIYLNQQEASTFLYLLIRLSPALCLVWVGLDLVRFPNSLGCLHKRVGEPD